MNLQLLNSEKTVERLHAIIKGSKKELILVSPYIKLNEKERLWQSLQVAEANKVRLTVVQRTDETGDIDDPDAYTVGRFHDMRQRGLQWLGAPSLHTKMYWSESAVLITSLNLLSSSITNSIEIGQYLEASEDVARARQYLDTEIRRLCRPIEIHFGHCIRCGDDIPFNGLRPYCGDDYEEWAGYGNGDYVDNFCHHCGKKARVTKNKPLCGDCFKEAVR